MGVGSVVSVVDDVVTVRFDRDGEAVRFIADTPLLSALLSSEEGRISPPWAEIHDVARFLPPLNQGELELARYLDDTLEPEWSIYIRPHLDADHPVIAAIHPTKGGMVWDVVGWDLNRVSIDRERWFVDLAGDTRQFVSPLKHLDDVRTKLYGTYLPEVGESINEGATKFSLVRAGLYFYNAISAQVTEKLGTSIDGKAVSAFGRDALRPGDYSKVVGPRSGSPMRAGWFEEFDRVLSHSQRQVDPLLVPRLTKPQEALTHPASGLTVIEGVAGSGKSTILAFRAARKAADGGRVVILTYNRTLANYIRAVLDRVPTRYQRDRVSVMHFHGLLQRIFADGSTRPPRIGATLDDQSEVLDEGWPAAALKELELAGIPDALRFDAFYVDEGQDFSVEYAQVIDFIASRLGSEVVVAHDPAQAIYWRRQAVAIEGHRWARARPKRLTQGVRISGAAAAAASTYAQLAGLKTSAIEPRESGLLPDGDVPTTLIVRDQFQAAAAVVAVLSEWAKEPGYLAGRAAVLVPSKEFGSALIHLLASHGVSTNHVFAVRSTGAMLDDPDPGTTNLWLLSKSHKDAFQVRDSRLKVSTIHSFKGWDAGRVIFVAPGPRSAPDEHAASAIYVGMTRSIEMSTFIIQPGAYGLDKLGLPELKMDLNPAIEDEFRLLFETVKRGTPTIHLANEAPTRNDEPPLWDDWPVIDERAT